jgi:hypothetical protein
MSASAMIGFTCPECKAVQTCEFSDLRARGRVYPRYMAPGDDGDGGHLRSTGREVYVTLYVACSECGDDVNFDLGEWENEE